MRHTDLPADKLFIGIDPSLTSTGVAILTHEGIRLERLVSKKEKGPARLRLFYDAFVSRFQYLRPDYVAIEGYAFGAVSHAHALGELGGVLRLALITTNTNFVVVPPTTLKKFITGSGVSKGKGPMMLSLYKNHGFEITQDDEADAACLALYAMASVMPEFASSKIQRETLTKGERFHFGEKE